jgi:RimJ/RimL family protein N-acetyltransferase
MEDKMELKHRLPAAVPEPVVLEGDWVRLEPLGAVTHTKAIWDAVRGHDEVWEWLGDGPYGTQAELYAALVAKETGTGARFFAILPKAASGLAGEAAGYASLMRIDATNGVIEVGNVLFAPILQRTRAATEAMYLMAKHIFEDLGYRRYEWKCNALNLPSRRAAVRLGFSFEGIFRQHMVVKGRNRDTAWFAMLDVEWPGRKAGFERWLARENFDADGGQIERLKTSGDQAQG